MTYEYLQVSNDHGIATLKINRPDALNALNQNVVAELKTFFHEAATDDTVRAIIITGAGDKAFVAGADIKEFPSMSPLEARAFAREGHKLTLFIESLSKPVVAAVNGYALGGGTELALACHLRFASENAVFGLPEVGLGIFPGWGGTQRLPRLIGKARAIEMIISAKKIDANTARIYGLVNEVYSGEDLLEKTKEFLHGVLKNGPRAVALAMEAIRSGVNMTLEEGLNLEANLFGVVFSTEDMKEGTSAFIEKRKPNFKGE